MYIDIGDRLICDKCQHECVVDEFWLSSFGFQMRSGEWIIKSDKLCSSKCSAKGSATKLTFDEYAEIINEIEREKKLQDIVEHARKNAQPGKPYKSITKGAWWTSDEANFEDLVRREFEDDIERNTKMDRD